MSEKPDIVPVRMNFNRTTWDFVELFALGQNVELTPAIHGLLAIAQVVVGIPERDSKLIVVRNGESLAGLKHIEFPLQEFLEGLKEGNPTPFDPFK